MVTSPPPQTCEYHGKKDDIYPPPALRSSFNPIYHRSHTPLGNRHLSPFPPPSISPGYAPRRKRWRPATVLDRRAVTVTDESGDSFCPRGAAAAAACFPAFLFWTRQAAELLHLGHFFLLFPLCVFFLGCYHFACCWLVGGTFVGGEAGGPGGRFGWNSARSASASPPSGR